MFGLGRGYQQGRTVAAEANLIRRYYPHKSLILNRKVSPDWCPFNGTVIYVVISHSCFIRELTSYIYLHSSCMARVIFAHMHMYTFRIIRAKRLESMTGIVLYILTGRICSPTVLVTLGLERLYRNSPHPCSILSYVMSTRHYSGTKTIIWAKVE
jgi:hypothetical protein